MSNPATFDDFGLSNDILKSITDSGYTKPSPIQEQCIKHLLNGRDIIGQAQTGTGKTAAFSLPLLDKIDTKSKNTQLLVLTPTRELAIQVSEAMKKYAKYIKGINILSIYGGQSYDIQLKPLKRGVQVVVGTPGRVMDHIKRKTLKLDNIKALVLDEADEMLKMGFIDDVKWVLGHIPKTRQIALFSATMPKEVKNIAEKFLQDPQIVKIKTKTETNISITQKYLQISGKNKLPALKRILEATITDGIIVFVRTKNDTVAISEQLQNYNYKSSALNGDIAQKERERIITNLRNGKLNIIVATDVAARGIDVPRISHVINYDIPREVELYVHRIGRTGRAGKSGEAILFASAKDMRMLKLIERITRQQITQINLPTIKEVNAKRIESFKASIVANLDKDLTAFSDIIAQVVEENSADINKVAASIALIMQAGKPFLLDSRNEISSTRDAGLVDIKAVALKNHPQIPMQRFRVEVGKRDKISAKNILGAIANEADVDSEYVGVINILDNFSTVDLPDEMPKDVLEILKNTRVAGRKLEISIFTGTNSRNPKKNKSGGKDSWKGKKKKIVGKDKKKNIKNKK